MRIIKVIDIINKENALSVTDGFHLFNILKDEYLSLKGTEQLEIDFDGITKTISAFLNASIGQLFGLEEEPEKVLDKINIINFPKGREERLKEVIQNAIETYKNKRDNINGNY